MVIKTLKKLFIPHIHNDYKPHFLREASVITISITVIVLLVVSAGTTIYIKNTDMTATVLPAVLVDLTNNARVSNNELTLTRNPVLDNAAKLKAENMASLGYFAHTSPTGISPWYWFDKAGYTFTYAGENLAIDFTESNDVETAWLNSPTHKANILSSHFTEIGIATVDGMYQGHPTTYVVQMFGKPALSTIAPEPVATPSIEPKPKTVAVAQKPKEDISKKVVDNSTAVKGESTALENNLETITDTQEFIAVKNNTTVGEDVEAASAHRAPRYSSWSQKFMFMAPLYTSWIYKVLIILIIVALSLMTIIEIRREHLKNIIYGILLLIIVICLVYINKSIFITSFFT